MKNKTHIIAVGTELVDLIIQEEYDLANESIRNNNGDIFTFNPTTDDFDELLNQLEGWNRFYQITEKEGRLILGDDLMLSK